VDDESEARHQQAWERYLEAERREVEMRRHGDTSPSCLAPRCRASPQQIWNASPEKTRSGPSKGWCSCAKAIGSGGSTSTS
jgi:hypothetical protein